MLQPSRTPRVDIVVAVTLLALAGLVWWESRRIAPPFFDPLGSAAFPRAAAILISALATVVLIRAAMGLRLGVRPPTIPYRPRPDLAIGVVLLAVLYVGAMDLKVLGFPWATMIFVFLSGAALGGFDRRIMAYSAAIAVALGGGCTYLLRDVFYIDLPF
ncbi:MAG: tripartite tricarboxylate transporter TctB family protein [Rhodospirillales bacterium]|nr:tripartite tricarboxylate transporter TctB family protein [Rhodospirillales bacterium]